MEFILGSAIYFGTAVGCAFWRSIMRKLALSAAAALLVLGSIGSAEAQVRYPHGYYRGGWGGHYYRGPGWRGGGAVAAGLIGGLVLGGLAAAAATPPYPYGYGYGAPYYGGYAYPPPAYPAYYGYRPAPYYGPGVVYRGDPYAAPHEYRDGYRTVYRPGYGRVIVGGPLY